MAGRSALPGERSATMGASHARFLPTYTQTGGRRGGDGGGDERSVPEPKAGSKYSQPGWRPPLSAKLVHVPKHAAKDSSLRC
jgi:hypothetical protein